VPQFRNKHNHSNTNSRGPHIRSGEQEFKCIQCSLLVTCAPAVAGVQNRNHCPACLWSRHLDWRAPGDRLSTCRAAMRPIGLTTKRSRNKYADERDGELMIVHQCTGCEKLVINRIAGDDSAAAIDELFAASSAVGPTVRSELAGTGVSILTARDGDLLRRRLFGHGAVGAQPAFSATGD